MKRVIYATSDLEDWIDVAKKMKKYQAWEPVYWITTPKNDIFIKERFPSTIRQDYIDAVRGKYREVNNFEYKIVLDEKMIIKYKLYEKIVIKMMDRMDPVAYSFNLSERVDLYYHMLRYWVNMISFLKPDIVLFSESPHGVFSYILYAVCIEHGTQIVCFSPTHIKGLTFLSYTISDAPEYLKKIKEKYLGKFPNRDDFTIANAYLEKNRGHYSKAMPYYMKDIIQKKPIHEKVIEYSGKLKRFLKNDTYLPFKKSKQNSISENRLTKIDFIYYKIYGLYAKKRLKKRYDMLAVEVDLTLPYIYVALHYQPEKTTSPDGGIFVDQWLMIQMLSGLIPKGWKIYVKEHISQFSDSLYGEQGRVYDFYERVLSLPHVELVKSDINSFKLIDNAKAVATVTGTVGLEAVMRGKPSLVFGNAWYKACHGVFIVKDASVLKGVINDINSNKVKIDAGKVDVFLYAVETISYPIYINPGNKAVVGISKKQNIHNITECLIKYSDNN